MPGEDKLAFEREYKGYKVRAFPGFDTRGDARIEFTHPDGRVLELSYPAYKIYNIAAHFEDIVDGELQGSDIGWRIAGSDGLGGGVMPTERKSEGN